MSKHAPKAPYSLKQADVLVNSTARWNFLEGAVRSGKTHVSLDVWAKGMLTLPPGNLLMVGKTERTLARNVLDPMRERYPGYVSEVKGDGEVYVFGRKCYVVGANDERSREKIQGITLAGAYGDEVTLWPQSFFQMLASRLSVAGARFIGTLNPDNPNHWLKVEYLDRSDDLDMRRWHFHIDDNTFLDPHYVDELKKEYIGVWYRRYILGEWCIAEGSIYSMFTEDVHVVETVPMSSDGRMLFRRYFVGVDYGTGNPTVFVLIGEDILGNWWAIGEYYWDSNKQQRQKSDAEYADDLANFLDEYLGDRSPDAIFVDPSAASFAVACRQYKDKPLKVVPANNAVIDGIRYLAQEFSSRRLFIHTGCKNLRRELAGYVWDPKAAEKGEDAPVKKNDHACDALRYGIYTVKAPRKGSTMVVTHPTYKR